MIGAYIDMLHWWHILLIWFAGVLVGYWYVIRYDKRDSEGDYLIPVAFFWPVCLTVITLYYIITAPFKFIGKVAEAGRTAAVKHKESKK